jgi:hypothetical protein
MPRNAPGGFQERLPPFWKPNPTLWFLQLDSVFAASRVTDSSVKFHAAIASLEPQVFALVQDLALNPGEQPYETLRERLVAEYTASEMTRVQNLLEKEQLGDRRPSHFLRHIRSLAGTLVSDTMVRSLWLRGLPKRMQELLSVVTANDTDDLARIADKAAEFCTQQPICALQPDPTPSGIAELSKQIENLQTQLAALAVKVDRMSRRPYRSQSRGRRQSRARTPSPDDICYYHRKFGNRAKKCHSPCNFDKKEKNAGN